jgi:predicted aspartyl protease
MRTLIQGKIVNFAPLFQGYLNEDKCLVLDESGHLALTVDTGFSGGIALPMEILNDMNVEFFGYDTFTLATGEVVELPMFIGKVALKHYVFETWFIPGDYLIGMEFLSSVGSALILNFEKHVVKLNK